MRLKTSVLLLPNVNAVEAAENVATLDHITHGRLDVGVAIGYREQELEGAVLEGGGELAQDGAAGWPLSWPFSTTTRPRRRPVDGLREPLRPAPTRWVRTGGQSGRSGSGRTGR
jgi:alkanesulfonate monooxygenase SsuD/methylene tetrahydromethanopterin reductase-like flavin-dependent oxidoreductase (luciferase family)